MMGPGSGLGRARVARIGLTGGIGAGKSTVASLWRDAGVSVIDVDEASRAVLRGGSPGAQDVLAEFGPGVRAANGEIDRSALAALVFDDESARERLEQIVYPRMWRSVLDQEEAAADAGEAFVVHDNPLLIEKGHAGDYEAVIVVQAPSHQRIERVMNGRSKSREYVESIMRAQASDEQRAAHADRVIVNDSTATMLAERSQDVLTWVRERYATG